MPTTPSPDRSSAKIVGPQDFCFILDLDSGEANNQLSFQLMPDTITEAKSANYEQIPILGRSLPHLGYSGSSARQINLSLEFQALRSSGEHSPQWVLDQARWLESKVYPQYADGFVYPPPRLILVIGQAIGMTCVMTSCSTTHQKPWHFDGGAAYPFRVQVDCAFEEWGENSDSYGHPHGHADAIQSNNQIYSLTRTGSGVVEIPLAFFETTVPGPGGF